MVAAICLLPAAGFSAMMWHLYVDDAFIGFIYSKNFASIGELRFRPSSLVAANSSLSWTVILGLMAKLGIPVPEGSKILGFLLQALSLVGLALVCLRLDRERSPASSVLLPTTPYVLLSVALASISVPGGVWSSYGLESSLVAFLLMLAILLRLAEWGGRARMAAWLPLTLLCATRPEGFLFAILFAALDLLRAALLRSWRDSVGSVCLMAAGVGSFELFNFYYYGVWTPDSAAAKVFIPLSQRLHEGMIYLLPTVNFAGVPAWFFWFAILACGAVLLVWFLRQRRISTLLRYQGMILIAGILCTQACFILVAGGDWMPNHRFLAHALGLALALGLLCLVELSVMLPLPRRLAQGAVALFVLSWTATQAQSVVATHAYLNWMGAAYDGPMQAMIDDLNVISRDTDTIALSDIGRASYGYRGQVFDWMGLADREISRNQLSWGRITPDAMYARRSRFLVLYSTGSVLNAENARHGIATLSERFVRDGRIFRDYRQVGCYRMYEARYHLVFERQDATDRPYQGAMLGNCR